MIKNRHVVAVFCVVIAAFLLATYYFMSVLTVSESEVRNLALSYEEEILKQLKHLPDFYHIKPIYRDNVTEVFINSLQKRGDESLQSIWKRANEEVARNNLFQISSSNLGNLINAMKTANVIKSDLDIRGTQLKFLLTLKGDQTVVFKPKWYEKQRTIEGPVYSGKDRYNSEILSFYLSAILNKPFAPVSVERILHLQNDILHFASKDMLNTTFKRKNSTCIYGQCYYCKKEDPICDINGYLTGVVIFNLGATFKTYRSPWQRTYKKNKKAPWELQNNYCKTLVGKISKQRLYDLVDTAVFDFLIQNGDRHHYETFHERVIWIDNGKGLGNPNVHHIDILAPLYQCCIIRSDTWNRLQSLSGGLLAEHLRNIKEVTDVVTEQHLNAINERLLIIFATVELCKHKNKIKNKLS